MHVTEMRPLEPGEIGAPPQNKDDLLIEALRFANRASGALNDISILCGSDDQNGRLADINEIAIRRFSDLSAVHLFIAAHNLRIDLPRDLDEKSENDCYA